MVRTKICGITSVADALYAASAGADALGFVFFESSPRYVEPNIAAEIIAQLPAFVTSVGLFVNARPAFIQQVIETTQLDLLQFHGDETESHCRQFGIPYIKAIRMQGGTDLDQQCHTFHSSRGILLDAYVPGKPGGTGQTFNWNAIPQQLEKPIILAGGLTPSNVKSAIETVRPWAVDVSGGVEQAKGKKDPARISAFIKGVQSVSL